MKIQETRRFRKSLNELDAAVLKKVKKQFILFLADPRHPSLNTEKLVPKEKNIWSFRVNKNFRVIFTYFDRETITLLDIGPHDIYKKI